MNLNLASSYLTRVVANFVSIPIRDLMNLNPSHSGTMS